MRPVEIATPQFLDRAPRPARTIRMSITFCSQSVGGWLWRWSLPRRWDVHDDFPQGRQPGRDILTLLRQVWPWPVLGAFVAEQTNARTPSR